MDTQEPYDPDMEYAYGPTPHDMAVDLAERDVNTMTLHEAIEVLTDYYIQEYLSGYTVERLSQLHRDVFQDDPF